jgi:hypothetical protein
VGHAHLASLVESYLAAERDLVAVVESVGGAAAVPDGRTVTIGGAEFDVLLGPAQHACMVIIRKQAPMPARR